MNHIEQRINNLLQYDSGLESLWKKERQLFSHKIIVLDDDPTGVQTVHDIPVFTDWSEETIEEVFMEGRQMVFILTNSRSFSEKKTKLVHEQIGSRISKISQKLNSPYLLISRGDSTLRGHYPLETEVLKKSIESESKIIFDGEVIIPFFKEGGRFTVDNIHYIKEGNTYIPVGESEFSKDRMFGFYNSNLQDYIEEKTEGVYSKHCVETITLEDLRSLNFQSIIDKLMQLEKFQKVIVNAVTEEDIKVFSIALLQTIEKGKNYLFRTAASFTKIIGNVKNKPYLKKEELIKSSNNNGGLIIIGSHVKKTTEQLNHLKRLTNLCFIEFQCELVKEKIQFETEIARIQSIINKKISQGTTVCVYTPRQIIEFGENKEEELALSVKISDALTQFVYNCNANPSYIIAKGGITSSSVGTKGLNVKKAEVIGQISPGVPVWKTGETSKFPHISYIIFPGNVGDKDTLTKIVEGLEE